MNTTTRINHTDHAHANTPAARAQCRRHHAKLDTLAALVDTARADMLVANQDTVENPYDASEYNRCSRVFEASLMAYANGDEKLARALGNLIMDSNESVDYYINNFSYNDMLADWAW